MHRFLQQLRNYAKQLAKIVDFLQGRLVNMPSGTLYIKHSKSYVQYYHQQPVIDSDNDNLHLALNETKKKNQISAQTSKTGKNLPAEKASADKTCQSRGSWKRIYIPKSQIEVAKALAQKSYDEKLLRVAEKQLSALDCFLKDFDPDALKKVFEELSPERKNLIDGLVLDDESFIRKWAAFQYSPGAFGPNDPEFYSKKGERVRSKSEVIIADTFREFGVPYRYEQPHEIIKGEKLWRPDFTVLNVRERKEIIFEHFGKMNDPDYVRRNMWKFSQYIRQGYFPGDKLVFTVESDTRPLSTKELELIIKKYLI